MSYDFVCVLLLECAHLTICDARSVTEEVQCADMEN